MVNTRVYKKEKAQNVNFHGLQSTLVLDLKCHSLMWAYWGRLSVNVL